MLLGWEGRCVCIGVGREVCVLLGWEGRCVCCWGGRGGVCVVGMGREVCVYWGGEDGGWRCVYWGREDGGEGGVCVGVGRMGGREVCVLEWGGWGGGRCVLTCSQTYDGYVNATAGHGNGSTVVLPVERVGGGGG